MVFLLYPSISLLFTQSTLFSRYSSSAMERMMKKKVFFARPRPIIPSGGRVLIFFDVVFRAQNFINPIIRKGNL